MFVITNVFTPHYHFMHLPKPSFTILPLYQKLWAITVSGLVTRAKFHTVWKLSEGAALISGIGYGKDSKGEDRFDCAQNVDITGVEFGGNVKEMFGSWNKFTANWLRRYVYVRVPFAALKLPMTFFLSAYWHGFYGSLS
jgi:lysophospholipid acyltransferase